MKVTILGCSGTYAGPGEACSGYLVQSKGTSVLIDAGAGVLASLQQHMAPEDLDAVVLTHSHPDHWVDAPILRNALRYVLQRAGLPVYSTAETLGLLSGVCHEHLAPTFRTEQISDGSELAVGGLRIRCSRTEHPPETLAIRLDDGEHTVAYSADTGAGWGFDEFGAPVDLGICEATYSEGTETAALGRGVHMTALEAGAMARRAGTRRLVITHLLPGADHEGSRAEAESAYGAPVEVAVGGTSVEI